MTGSHPSIPKRKSDDEHAYGTSHKGKKRKTWKRRRSNEAPPVNVRVDITHEDPVASFANPSVTRPRPNPHPVVRSSESPTMPAASSSAGPSTTCPTPLAAETLIELEHIEGQVDAHVEQIEGRVTQARGALVGEPVVGSHNGVVSNDSRVVSSFVLLLVFLKCCPDTSSPGCCQRHQFKKAKTLEVQCTSLNPKVSTKQEPQTWRYQGPRQAIQAKNRIICCMYLSRHSFAFC